MVQVLSTYQGSEADSAQCHKLGFSCLSLDSVARIPDAVECHCESFNHPWTQRNSTMFLSPYRLGYTDVGGSAVRRQNIGKGDDVEKVERKCNTVLAHMSLLYARIDGHGNAGVQLFRTCIVHLYAANE